MTEQIWTDVSTVPQKQSLVMALMSRAMPFVVAPQTASSPPKDWQLPHSKSVPSLSFCSKTGRKVGKGSSPLYSCGHPRISSRCETPGMKQSWSTLRTRWRTSAFGETVGLFFCVWSSGGHLPALTHGVRVGMRSRRLLSLRYISLLRGPFWGLLTHMLTVGSQGQSQWKQTWCIISFCET